MSTNGHHPDTNGRDPLRADEWLEARHAARRGCCRPRGPSRRLSAFPARRLILSCAIAEDRQDTKRHRHA